MKLYTKEELKKEPKGTTIHIEFEVEWQEGKYKGIKRSLDATIKENNVVERGYQGCSVEFSENIPGYGNMFINYEAFKDKMEINYYNNQKLKVYKK